MDHSECRKRICQLEDDLDYNLERKEQLKQEVQQLDDSNDRLRKINFKNAEVSLKKESILNKLVETLRKELDELKSNDLTESLKSENKILADKIESLKKKNGRKQKSAIASEQSTQM